jgi:outer membrane protein
MKRTATLLFVVLLCSISFLPGAGKIGYIDSQRVINGYQGMSGLKGQYNKLVAEWEEEAQEKRTEIEKLKSELQEQEPMLSEETKKKKRNEIKQKEEAYEEFLKDVWGENGKAKQKHEELLRPIIEELSNILEKIGEEEGYEIIFDISEGNIVYVKVGLDLTERVLFEINKEFTIVAPEKEESAFYVFQFKELGAEAESKGLGSQIAALLNAGLNKLEYFEKIEGHTVNEAMQLLGFLTEDELEDNQVSMVARRIEADLVVFGTVELASGRIMVKLKWIYFEEGAGIKSKDFSIDEDEKLEVLAQDVMTHLGRMVKEK